MASSTFMPLTSKPASFSASRHSSMDLMSGSPLPSSTSPCIQEHKFITPNQKNFIKDMEDIYCWCCKQP